MDQNRSHDIFRTLGAPAAVATVPKGWRVINIYTLRRLYFSVKADFSNPDKTVTKWPWKTTVSARLLRYISFVTGTKTTARLYNTDGSNGYFQGVFQPHFDIFVRCLSVPIRVRATLARHRGSVLTRRPCLTRKLQHSQSNSRALRCLSASHPAQTMERRRAGRTRGC